MIFYLSNFSAPLPEDLTPYPLGNSWFLPEWIEILLDLVRYEHARLKETAILFLISSFSQQSNFISSALKIQILYDPHLSRLYYESWTKIQKLKFLAKNLGHANVTKRDAAFEWCSKQLREFRKLLTVSARTPRKVIFEIQTVLSNVGLFDSIVMILFFHIPRVPSTEPGVLDAAADSQLLGIFADAYSVMGAMCEENPANQVCFQSMPSPK